LLASFFLTIDAQYITTFVSIQRGKGLTLKKFREGDDSTKAAYIFQVSNHHWESIEEEVRGWVEMNWDKWD